MKKTCSTTWISATVSADSAHASGDGHAQSESAPSKASDAVKPKIITW
jgi:hypothetical protein